ncbi:9211_t:CDS:2 [Acaulospora morrowiae]|uniref:Protein with SprT-like domain at the N terminus n=1 Tax=Acaulospora morrowiae TaxID=94023 RepID=A0A9N9H998_9GLOM|nr:9211_t:CDS:2 [Acaulospora morrowiae]
MEFNENEDASLALALKLQTEEKNSMNQLLPKLPNDELIHEFSHYDANPDLHGLFITFNQQYFWNSLQSVECAGLCRYQSGGYCSIRMSEPLLKFRTRQDMIETLLHEMIHAYLFVTKNNRDHDAHGQEFHKHMNRINKAAGTNITVYHNFHDEVNYYRTHGQCQYKAPYFGIVRRAMNRPPQPADSWWNEHQESCRGKFTKISEPPKKEATKKSTKRIEKRKREIDDAGSNTKLDSWLGSKRKKDSTGDNDNIVQESRVIEIDSGEEASPNSVQCPICGNSAIKESDINEHVDLCLWLSDNRR